MIRIIPEIGSSGYFRLKPPLDSLISTGERYTCMAIRSISDYLANNEDPLEYVYKSPLTEEIYKEHVKNKIEIVSLQSDKGHWLYVPSIYFDKYPDTNGPIYRSVSIGVSLPSLPVTESNKLEKLEKEFREIVLNTLGVESKTKIIQTSKEVHISELAHKNIATERLRRTGDKYNNTAKYKKLILIHQKTLNKIRVLERFLVTKKLQIGLTQV